MANNTAKVSTLPVKAQRNSESGRKARGSDGSAEEKEKEIEE
jgi:hypothetical protein